MDTPDHIAIANLLARYAELLNLGRFAAVGELFRHGKLTFEGAPIELVGPDAVADLCHNTVKLGSKVPDTPQFVTNLQIDVDGDQATSRSYFLAMQETNGAIVPVAAGRYHDAFRRIDGAWWFHERHMFPDLFGDLSAHVN